MVTTPFTWGQGGQKLTAGQARSQRAIAEALANQRKDPQNMWEGVQSAIGQIGGALLNSRADAAEADGRKLVAESLGAGDYMAAMGNEWASPNQLAVAKALYDRELQQMGWDREDNDPMRQLQLQAAQQGLEKGAIELEGMRNPVPKPAEPFTLSAGQSRFAGDGSVIASVPEGENDGLTDTQRNLLWRAEQAGLVPGTPEWNQFMVSGGQGGMALSVGADGAVSFTTGNAKPLTEGQSKDTVYATRAEGALPLIDQFGAALTNPLERAVEGDPTGLARGLQSPEFQQAQQAGKEFLQAILRKDTGAAITPQETAEYGSVYLPVPGDSPAVLEQKRVSRSRALEAIKAGLPPAAILAQEQALNASGSTQPMTPEAMPVVPAQIDYNAAEPPAGWAGNPDLWRFMSPEDRALW